MKVSWYTFTLWARLPRSFLDKRGAYITSNFKIIIPFLKSNSEQQIVENFFEEYDEPDYLRTGGKALENVEIPEGPLPQFGHAMEPQLRALGLPTSLKKGVIHLLKSHSVCKQGEKLTSEQAQILKLLDYKHASFRIDIVAAWCKDKDGSANFQLLMENENSEGPNDSDAENDSMNDD